MVRVVGVVGALSVMFCVVCVCVCVVLCGVLWCGVCVHVALA